MVCLKVLYLKMVLFSSSCALLLSALSCLTHLQIITSVPMTLNFSYLFQLPLIFIILLDLLETAISSVFNWMSANFLTLNPSETEFLIIGLPQQLSKFSSSKTIGVYLRPAFNIGRRWIEVLRYIGHALSSPLYLYLSFLQGLKPRSDQMIRFIQLN